MKYAIVKCINGNFSIHAEGFTTLEGAKINYHGLCQTLWNAPDVITGSVAIVDEHFSIVEPYREYISHPVEQPET